MNETLYECDKFAYMHGLLVLSTYTMGIRYITIKGRRVTPQAIVKGKLAVRSNNINFFLLNRALNLV